MVDLVDLVDLVGPVGPVWECQEGDLAVDSVDRLVVTLVLQEPISTLKQVSFFQPVATRSGVSEMLSMM